MLNLRNLKHKRQQTGFTLTELMIAVALGMSVISSVLVGYLATYSGSVGTLANSKLTQEMATLMSLMVNDIRRAGYTSNAAIANTPIANPFSQINITALEVFNALNDTQVGDTASGLCIVFAYDANENTVVDAAELLGFRLNGGVVETRALGNVADPDTCATASNTWTPLTDADFMIVTTLNFSLAQSECLNAREPNSIDDDADGTEDNAEEYDCYDAPLPAAGSGDITVETRQVTITLEANLTDDAFVRSSMTQNVRVRNDLIRIR